MILFFRTPTKSVIATEVSQELASEDIQKLSWLYGEATVENEENLKGCFIGPRREMITPWSTNAVEITQNMGLTGVLRIEEYFPSMPRDPRWSGTSRPGATRSFWI